MLLPLFEHEKRCHHDEEKTNCVVPLDILLEIQDREKRKNYQGNDLLNGLQLGCIEMMAAPSVGRHLQTILKESNAPAYYDGFPECDIPVPEVAVPGKGHEYIRQQEKNDGAHRSIIQFPGQPQIPEACHRRGRSPKSNLRRSAGRKLRGRSSGNKATPMIVSAFLVRS